MPHAQAPTPPAPGETLRLDDALKLAGVASTGGEAKVMIQGGAVRVNGTVETRRKRKLVEGDVVEVGDETFEIAIADVDDEDDELAADAAPGGGADPDAEDDDPVGGIAARDADPYPIRAPGAGELEDDGEDEDDDEDDWDDEDDEDDDGIELRSGFDDLDDEDDDALRLDDDDLARWTAWIEDRVADDDVEAVIIRLGALHPDALEAVFERLPADVEERVLDGLDAVLEGAEEDGSGGPGDAPMQA
jgi:ribosome-associated protein